MDLPLGILQTFAMKEPKKKVEECKLCLKDVIANGLCIDHCETLSPDPPESTKVQHKIKKQTRTQKKAWHKRRLAQRGIAIKDPHKSITVFTQPELDWLLKVAQEAQAIASGSAG